MRSSPSTARARWPRVVHRAYARLVSALALPRLETALIGASALAALVCLQRGMAQDWSRVLELWAFAAPVLVGLVHGLRSSLLVAAVLGLAARAGGVGVGPLWDGGFVASVILGAFAGHLWDVRSREHAGASDRLQRQARQLEAQFRDQQVLRASHAQLAERASAQRWSLAASVDEALRSLPDQSLAEACHSVLALLESQAMVRAAAVYLAPVGKLSLRPAATLGLETQPVSAHAVVAAALRTAALAMPEEDLTASGAPVLAVPLVTSSGAVFGVVAVHQLPFVALHQAHFRLIATLTGALADPLRAKLDAVDVPIFAAAPVASAHPTLQSSLVKRPTATAPRTLPRPQLVSLPMPTAATKATVPGPRAVPPLPPSLRRSPPPIPTPRERDTTGTRRIQPLAPPAAVARRGSPGKQASGE